jgi:hypothetical protein
LDCGAAGDDVLDAVDMSPKTTVSILMHWWYMGFPVMLWTICLRWPWGCGGSTHGLWNFPSCCGNGDSGWWSVCCCGVIHVQWNWPSCFGCTTDAPFVLEPWPVVRVWLASGPCGSWFCWSWRSDTPGLGGVWESWPSSCCSSVSIKCGFVSGCQNMEAWRLSQNWQLVTVILNVHNHLLLPTPEQFGHQWSKIQERNFHFRISLPTGATIINCFYCILASEVEKKMEIFSAKETSCS